jgi:hypothetical protein
LLLSRGKEEREPDEIGERVARASCNNGSGQKKGDDIESKKRKEEKSSNIDTDHREKKKKTQK